MDGAAGIAPKAKRAQPTQPTLNWAPPEGDPTVLLLARHGRTAHTAGGLFSGHNDEPLSADGEHEAAALARRLARRTDIAAVVSSPLRRTAQTAERIATALGLPVTEHDGLKEADFGVWEGRTGREIRAQWGEEFTAWITDPDAAPPGGESFAQVTRRVRQARDELIRTHPGGTVVVVSHVTPIKTLLRLALDAPQTAMIRLHLDPASLSRISYYADGSSSVGLFNDTAHLEFPPN